MYLFLLFVPAVLLVDSMAFWLLYAVFVIWWWSAAASLQSLGLVALELGAALSTGILMRAFMHRPLFPLLAPNGWKTINSIGITLLLALVGLYGYGHMIELTGSTAPVDLFPVGRLRSIMSITLILSILYACTQKWQVVLSMQPKAPEGHAANALANQVYHNAQVLMPLGFLMGAMILLDVVLLQPLRRNLALLGVLGGGWALFTIFNTFWLLSLTAQLPDPSVLEPHYVVAENQRRKGS
jgi:hypothetical protein